MKLPTFWQGLLLLLTIACGAPAALAQTGGASQAGGAYVRDSSGAVVRNSSVGDARIGNLCWRSGYWTPAQALRECDADLFPAPVTKREPVIIDKPKDPEPPRVRDDSGGKCTLNFSVRFDFDKAVITPAARRVLDEFIGQLGKVNLEVIIAIGHTDGIGGDAYNQKLSLRRAEAVKAYLVSHGVDANRVYVEGRGKTQPLKDNRYPEGRAQNRRVEIEAVGVSR